MFWISSYDPDVLSDDKFPPSAHHKKGDSEPESCISPTQEQRVAAPSASLVQSSEELPLLL
jgi:hypothetical protein